MHSGHNKSHIRLTKFPTNTPPGVGDRFIVPVSLHCQIRIFTPSNTHIRFIANGCPHLKIRIFKSPHTHFRSSFCGHLWICGHDKSAPTAANGLPQRCWRIGIIWQTFCKISTFNHEMRANDLQQHNIQKSKTILLQCKNPLFARQKPYFYTPKTILLFCEYVTYTE